MFIEVTALNGNKYIINSKNIEHITSEEAHVEIWIDHDRFFNVKESYDDIKTLLNAKWVAE